MKTKRNWIPIIVFASLVCIAFIVYFTIQYFTSSTQNASGTTKAQTQLPYYWYIIFAIIAAVSLLYKSFGDLIIFRLTLGFMRGQTRESLNQKIQHEKEYLDNLIKRLNSDTPWEIERFTELEALGNGIEIEGRKSKPRKSISKSKGQVRLLEEHLSSKVNVRKYLEKQVSKDARIMLKGEPGSGKTMMARRYTADTAQKAMNSYGWSLNPLLPVYIPLNAYNTTDTNGAPIPFIDFIKSYLKTEYEFADYIINNLPELLKAGRLILVLDGLNEMPYSDSKIRIKNIEQLFRKDYPATKCLITCRNIQFTSFDYKTIEINELSNEQIRKFIEIYQGESMVEPIFDEISSSHDISFKRFRNPFILRIYLQRDFTTAAPSSLAMLYSEYVNSKFTAYENDRPELIDKLKKISFFMSNSGLFAGYIDIQELREQLKIDITDDFLNKCASVNIVDHSMHGKFRFYHQIFQEYFSALVFDDMANNDTDYISYLRKPEWEEIILVWGGIVEDLQKLLNQLLELEDMNVRDLCMALKLCSANPGKVPVDCVESIIEISYEVFRNREIIPKVDTLKALATLETPKSIELIGLILRSSSGWIRELCIQILGKSENEEARQELTKCLKTITSFKTFRQAGYFLPFNKWVMLYLKNTLTVTRMIGFIGNLFTYGFIFIPFLTFGLLCRGAVSTQLDPLVLMGRIISIVWAYLILNSIRLSIKDIREDNLPINFKTLRYIFSIDVLAMFSFLLPVGYGV